MYNGTGDGDDYVGAIHIDEDGNIYVGGSSKGTETTGWDFFVWKLAPNGQPVWPTSGSYTGYQFDALGALRTTSTLNEGYIGAVGFKVDMAVRKSSNPANRSIAITGIAQAQSGPSNDGYWRTILFQQKTTGTPVEIFSGWPQDIDGATTKDDFPGQSR